MILIEKYQQLSEYIYWTYFSGLKYANAFLLPLLGKFSFVHCVVCLFKRNGLILVCQYFFKTRADNWKMDEPTYNETVDGPKHNGLTDFGKVE